MLLPKQEASFLPVTVLSLILLLSASLSVAAETQRIAFKSADNIVITADSYIAHAENTIPLILLFHQAGSSRGEYNDIAPALNNLGFNCIAVDLRSGEYSRGKDNETAMHAVNAGLPTNYLDALPDMIAALRYAKANHPDSKIIIWGSSYSAALVLKIAGGNTKSIDGVIAFSPGEYFSSLGKSKTWIRDAAAKIKAPVFITSAKHETENWTAIYDAVDPAYRNSFIPETAGRHGSKALWKKYSDSSAYWHAVTQFLKTYKN